MHNLITGEFQFSLKCKFEALRCGIYLGEAFILKKNIYTKFQSFVVFPFQITLNNYHDDIQYLIFQMYQLVSFFHRLCVYSNFHMHLNLARVKLWSGFLSALLIEVQCLLERGNYSDPTVNGKALTRGQCLLYKLLQTLLYKSQKWNLWV